MAWIADGDGRVAYPEPIGHAHRLDRDPNPHVCGFGSLTGDLHHLCSCTTPNPLELQCDLAGGAGSETARLEGLQGGPGAVRAARRALRLGL